VPSRIRKLVRAATSPDPHTRPDTGPDACILAPSRTTRPAAAPTTAAAESPACPLVASAGCDDARPRSGVTAGAGRRGRDTSRACGGVFGNAAQRDRGLGGEHGRGRLLAALIIMMVHGPARTDVAASRELASLGQPRPDEGGRRRAHSRDQPARARAPRRAQPQHDPFRARHRPRPRPRLLVRARSRRRPSSRAAAEPTPTPSPRPSPPGNDR